MRHQVLRELKGLRVLVVHPPDEEGRSLVDHLRRIGCQVEAMWPVPETCGRFDVIMLTIEHESREAVTAFLKGFGTLPPAIVSMVSFEDPSTLQIVLETGSLAVVERPVRPFGLLTNLIIARSLWLDQAETRKRIAKLERKLDGIQNIQKAKSLLMHSQGLNETAAYEMIRKQAMSKRVAMEEIATAIINAHDLLNIGPKHG
ncbi:MAG: ANTAR domain-containing response regulator [Bauldia sp.]